MASPGTITPASLKDIVLEFSKALEESGIFFGDRHEEVVRTFVVSLITKPFVILTGLSGSGKTQLALKFGEWLGPDHSLLVPVRPDWTGAEALFGYEDALDTSKDTVWIVPAVLRFMLNAAADSGNPYLLILDEMNLAHVERYFADFLSGVESQTPVLPNLKWRDGRWVLRTDTNEPERIPMPSNLFVAGTVNVDETTYMFSPKVLDRANTIEFRVRTDELRAQIAKPTECSPADEGLVQSFLALAKNTQWQDKNPASYSAEFAARLKDLHRILSYDGFEFGHRVFYEAIRYAAFFEAAGGDNRDEALDFQVYQKILPRLHGSQKRLGPTLRAVAAFCVDPDQELDPDSLSAFPQATEEDARLKRSLGKLKRMNRDLTAYQFTSFTE